MDSDTFNAFASLEVARNAYLRMISEFELSQNALNKAFLAGDMIKPDTDLRALVSDLAILSVRMNEYLDLLAKSEQNTVALEQTEKLLEAKSRILQEQTFRLTNAKRAIAAIEKINSEFSRETALISFFNKNRPLIVNIFKAIHSPNEFDDIQIEQKKIFVVRGNDRRELSTVSTGQRTAVALSLFLGMHLTCPMAPKVILFDDPVSFVDDLNILAFLDFLRELAFAGGRQIFFATANKKLASLFKMKFDALGAEFETIAPSALTESVGN